LGSKTISPVGVTRFWSGIVGAHPLGVEAEPRKFGAHAILSYHRLARIPDPGQDESLSDARQRELRYSSAQGRWVIAATVLGSSIAMLDANVVGIALPAIGRDFGASIEALQWVTNAYTLTLAALMLLGGTLGDRYGRRRMFLTGVIWFGAASALCSVAWNVEALILARGLQGVGGALLTPGSLAILEASFVEEDRSRAIGAWSGLGGVATAMG